MAGQTVAGLGAARRGGALSLTTQRWLWLVCALGLGLRLSAVGAVQVGMLGHRAGQGRFVFADSEAYWALGTRLASGESYQFGHNWTFRTPGYPSFVALVVLVFGKSVIMVRIAQAFAGALACVPAYYLGRRWFGPRAGLLGAVLTALDPYLLLSCGLVISETVFSLLLVLTLSALAALGQRIRWGRSAIAGVLAGLAVLVRPSFLFFVPVGWLLCACRFRRQKVWLANLTIALVVSLLILVPWWIWACYRTGGVVLTTTMAGASLHDGLGPQATGTSDMRFMSQGDPGWTERERDAYWRQQALQWAIGHPGDVLRLAGVKFLKFWSPWPNAPGLKTPLVQVASAVWVVPLYVLVGYGVWRFLRRPVVVGLLAGPATYFCALHMVFVSSIRYRIVALPGLLVLGAGVVAGCVWGVSDEPQPSSLQPGGVTTDND